MPEADGPKSAHAAPLSDPSAPPLGAHHALAEAADDRLPQAHLDFGILQTNVPLSYPLIAPQTFLSDHNHSLGHCISAARNVAQGSHAQALGKHALLEAVDEAAKEGGGTSEERSAKDLK